MQNRWLIPAAVIISVLVFLAGCTTPTSSSPANSPVVKPDNRTSASNPSPAFTLRVDSLVGGSVLPDVYTCKGAGETPEVAWDGIPVGTKSLVLILDDPDAPNSTFTHWLVFNIPPVSSELARAQPNTKTLDNSAQQARTSSGLRGYIAPCPPIGSIHRYIFRLFAVDMDINQPSSDRESINWALSGHTIAKTEFATTFKR